MDIKEMTRSVIEDYFSITGRPIATLTVEEYGKFLEIAKTSATYISLEQNSFSIPTTQHIVAQPVATEPAQPIEPLVLDPCIDSTAKSNTVSEVIPIKGTEVQKSRPVKKEEKKKPSKEEMLKIIRSVSS